MQDEFESFNPDLSSVFKKMTLKELKYNYALQNVIFYSVHLPDDNTLSYYKDGPIELDENAPAIFRFIESEFEHLDFHQRFWELRAWVAEQNRISSTCGLSFVYQTYQNLMLDLGLADSEAERILSEKKNEY